MADGKIVIAVDVDGKQVSVLNKNLDQLEGKSSKAGASIKNMAVSMGLVKVAGAAFKVLANSLDQKNHKNLLINYQMGSTVFLLSLMTLLQAPSK